MVWDRGVQKDVEEGVEAVRRSGPAMQIFVLALFFAL